MWKSIAELVPLRIPVTPSTLVSHLETLGRLEGLGGPESVSSFIDVLDIKPKPELYMRQVSEFRFRSDLRRLTQAASNPRRPAESLLEQITMLSDQYRKRVGTETKLKFHCGGCNEPEFQNAIKWICRPWIAEGAITEVAGKLKTAGKTTFVSHMIKSILKGAPFLGQETTQTGVVYLSEQPRTSFRASMQRVNAMAEPQFFFLTAPETITNEWNKLTEAAISECLDRNARVLVVDTIGQLARMPGDSAINTGDALTVLQPLQRAASKGLGVVIIRHERKSGGDVGDFGRGSTAFGGAVDTIISIRRP